MGKFQTFTQGIDLNADRKRFWPARITSVHSDLCVGSSPHDVNLGGRLYAQESGMAFSGGQEDYNPYDNEEDGQASRLGFESGWIHHYSGA